MMIAALNWPRMEGFFVGSFILENIEKAKRNIPVIFVTIEVDVNGIINVTATD